MTDYCALNRKFKDISPPEPTFDAIRMIINPRPTVFVLSNRSLNVPDDLNVTRFRHSSPIHVELEKKEWA